MQITADFPEKLQFLFTPMRYKVAMGGRGSAKSWSFARALLIQAANSPLRVLCAREIQKSIKDSVHKLLSDQVTLLGLSSFYTVQETTIKGRNGSEFIFAGLAQHTVDSIKSYEGLDRVWIEEGQTISKRSMDILIPTIRKDGSEIWISFNPELDSDPIYEMFVTNKSDNCISVIVNYSDNPWFNAVLELERLRCMVIDPKGYPNIWEGKCKPAVTGAIYYDEMEALDARNGIRPVPHDPLLKVHVVLDLGWNDAMAISLVQRTTFDLRVIDYIEDSHKTLAYYSNLLRENKEYHWGKMFLPHDGTHKNIQTGKSAGETMEALGWEVEYTESVSVEDGIKLVRMTLGRMFFNKDRTERLIQCLKRYRRAINQTTQEAGQPLHDEFSHGADNVRYVALNADKMDNDIPQPQSVTMIQARLKAEIMRRTNGGMTA